MIGPVAVDAWALDVWVPGRAVTKGSTRSFINKSGKLVTIADNHADQADWKPLVATFVRQGWGHRPVTEDAVALRLDFVLPRRASAPKTFTPRHTRKPDADKLIRMILDVLTGLVYADDAQVTQGVWSKREAERGEASGVRIRLAVLPPVGRPPARSTRIRGGTGVRGGGLDAP